MLTFLVYNSLYTRGPQQVISCAIAGGWTQTTGYTAAFLHRTKLWQGRWDVHERTIGEPQAVPECADYHFTITNDIVIFSLVCLLKRQQNPAPCPVS